MSYLFNQTSANLRTGEQSRVNLDRFFHIMNEGWFVYLRRGSSFAVNNKDSIAGPFDTKTTASDYLNQQLHARISTTSTNVETSKSNCTEDWRY